MKTKFIFETGGVLSGLGKGVTNASIGNLLKARGYKIFAIKLDPYLNIDPSAMSPIEHGEVFVTADGGETDLDLGHYERFIDVKLSKDSSFTSGKIYTRIFANERNGVYGGKTVQIVPHVIDEIINIILDNAKKYEPDFMLIEIGGTVGDIESNPFIYAISKFAQMYPENVFFNHIAFVPYLSASKEYKSKPSQVSIATLRSFGINPNVLLLRSQGEVDESIITKIARSSFLDPKNVISIPDMANIFEIPLYLEEQHICDIILNHFKMKSKFDDKVLLPWKQFVEKNRKENKKNINIALVGKYAALEDSYLSIIMALKIASIHQEVKFNYDLLDVETLANDKNIIILNNYDGVVILPGFNFRGFEAKVRIANYVRENKIPTLGLAFGFQAMIIEQAQRKNILSPTSEEFKKHIPNGTFIFKNTHPEIENYLHLGEDKILLTKSSLIHNIYKQDLIYERHRNRYDLDSKWTNQIEDDKFKLTGLNPNSNTIEVCELKNHPFYVGVQYQPEFNSRVLTSHPLFDTFIKTTIQNKK